MLVALSALSSGVPVKPMNMAPGSSCFMAVCILPDCVRCASSTKTKRLPLAVKSFGILALRSLMKSPSASSRRLVVVDAAELVNQRADEPLLALVQGVEQIRAAAGSVDLLVDAVEDLLDLFIKLGAVGDQQDPRIVLVLADPLRQPHHRQGLARALGVPDDAALALGDPLLRSLHAEELVVASRLLDARVEDHEVVDHLQQPILASTSGSAPGRAGPRRLTARCHSSQYFSGVSMTP